METCVSDAVADLLREPSAVPLRADSVPEDLPPLAVASVEGESRLYGSSRWCLNAFPTLRELTAHLRRELDRVSETKKDWQRDEAITNVFLMSCAVADTTDDYLLGARYDFSKAEAILPVLRPVTHAMNVLLELRQRARAWRRRSLARWRTQWGAAVEEFLAQTVICPRPDQGGVDEARRRLGRLLGWTLPDDLGSRRPRMPGAFRRHDLTHHDVVALARKFVAAYPDRRRPLLVLGLRTAGSYFAPLLTAYLRVQGYVDIESATIHPKKGIAPWEATRLTHGAQPDALTLVIDEPLDTGATLVKTVDLLRRAGLGAMVALLPVHPTRRDWTVEALGVADVGVVRLEPEEWYKRRLLVEDGLGPRLRQYFQRRGYSGIRIVPSKAADEYTARLEGRSDPTFTSRLKRVFEARLQHGDGHTETRYILAKSVGWGWLGYHAFIAAQELSPFLPPVLGLRDGILYTEWLPQSRPAFSAVSRDTAVRTIASYVGVRARSLRLEADPSPDLVRHRYHEGVEMLSAALSRAYGSRPAAALKAARLRHELSRLYSRLPTLIDGRMRSGEWILGADTLLKTDFEQHGLGKSELNITDPAYDLADAVLALGLSQEEEHILLEQYAKESGDHGAGERLFLNKLLAGLAAMSAARSSLADPRLDERQRDLNRRHVEAWNFLTAQTARFCGRLCGTPERIRWRSPLVVLDIDGVVDRRIFGFPSTTAAGIRALGLLHAHGAAIALDTARALGEAKTYCEAYGCAGAVAEYGSAAWDAVSGRERILVSPATLSQLDRVRRSLLGLPGVFVDETYRYSIRAYTYDGKATTPLPTALVEELLPRLGADELTARQNTIDTAIHARDVDKGRGLVQLLDLAGLPAPETIAIGDSETDLAMFRVATRSFAPANILCPEAARQLGCHIVEAPYQRGLLQAVRLLLHPDGRRCEQCRSVRPTRPRPGHLFLDLLEVADHGRARSLLHALLDPMALKAFLRPE